MREPPSYAGSIFLKRGIDLVDPGEDAAFEVHEVVEAVLRLQLFDRLAAAAAAAAVDHHLPIARDLCNSRGELFHGDVHSSNLADVPLERLAHVDERERAIGFELRREIAYRKLLDGHASLRCCSA